MTKKQDASKYIGLIHELQTHRDPFVIRPILDRFEVPRHVSRALEGLGYITTTGKTVAHRCQWVGTVNPSPGQLKLMAVATMAEADEVAKRDKQSKKRVLAPQPPLPLVAENIGDPATNAVTRYAIAIHEMSSAKGLFSTEGISTKNNISNVLPALKQLKWAVPQRRGRYGGTVWVGPRPKDNQELMRMAETVQRVTLDLIREDHRRHIEKKAAKPATPKAPQKAVEASRNAFYKEIAKVVPPQPTNIQPKPQRHTSKRISILWGLFTWESK
jgi:hypothetical protein